jgi:hypothetical protein
MSVDAGAHRSYFPIASGKDGTPVMLIFGAP